MAEHATPGAFVWKDNVPDEAAAIKLSRDLKLPLWFARLLISRGFHTADEVEHLLNPKLGNLGDPFSLPGMQKAVDRALSAIESKERITIFGDYDVDGLTSAALLQDVLERSGARIMTFLPSRLDEGYGLSIEALSRCMEETRPNLIITVDCGTGSVDSVAEAVSHGIDVIITDHHHVGNAVAPAVAVVNPRISPDERLHILAGVGVAFKFAHAILKQARKSLPDQTWSQFDPKELLDLVALGTIADLVPLREENRILVSNGLKWLNRTRRTGLTELINIAGIKDGIDTYEVGFLLGPRLNASGRLGTAITSLKLLTTDDLVTARECARELDSANRERQQVERGIVLQLHQQIDAVGIDASIFSLVRADKDWHPGVVGIVASRMVQKYFRPAIIIGCDDQGRAKGSCRSISGFNMVEALSECSHLLVKHGGHAMAAGIEIEWEKIPEFSAAFEQVAAKRLSGQDLSPVLRVDGWLTGADLRDGLMDRMDRLRPFGMGNPEPVWACRGMAVAGSPREVGTGHLKAQFSLEGTLLDAIGFGLFHKPLPDGPVDVAFHLRKDVFRGETKTTMHIKDFRATTAQ